MIEVDAIFFDVDGTLVDARKDIVSAMNHTMRQLGTPELPHDFIVSCIGTGVKDLVRKCLGRERLDLSERAVKLFSDYYLKHPTDEAVLYPHVKETLEYFKDKRKVIISNRFKIFADVTLKSLGIRDYFEDIIGGDDEKCLKPSACVLDKVLSRLDIAKERSIIVGDMSIDIMTGKNSGVKTCWVSYGLGSPEDAIILKPDYMIDDIAKLKKILK